MKGLMIHLVLAVGGLIWAYQAWTGDGEAVSEDAVTMLSCDEGALESVVYATEAREVHVSRRSGEGEPRWWITSEQRMESGDVERREFLGSIESMQAWTERLTPLMATRDLGPVDDETAEELELGEEPDTLTIQCGSRTHEFQVGGSAFGSGSRYFRDGAEGRVYLVEAALMRDLNSPNNLMQRELVDVEYPEVATLEVDAFDVQRVLQHRNRLDEHNAEWVDAAEPTRRNELFTNWVGAFRRLRAHRYVAAGAEPLEDIDEEATASALGTVRLKDEDGGLLEEVEMVRLNIEGQAAPLYYARSGATQGWVRLLVSVARQYETDLRPVLGLNPEPEPEVEPPPAEAAETEGEPESDGPAGPESEESTPEPEAPEDSAEPAPSPGSSDAID